jgi:hypothetical protein
MDFMKSFPINGTSQKYLGIVKIKLVHTEGASIFLTDSLFVNFADGWRWFQPHMFGPPILSFWDDLAYAQFDLELSDGTKLLVGVTKDRYIRRFVDGAHIFHCYISAPINLERRATGIARQNKEGGFELLLFHHTAPTVAPIISSTGILKTSTWNYQGTKRLKNISYAYLTSVSKIETEKDLTKLAMSSKGFIFLLPDDRAYPDELVKVKVYRENTLNRTATLKFWVASEFICSTHVLRHAPLGEPVFYENLCNAIFRIGVEHGQSIPIEDDLLQCEKVNLKFFEYIVIGDATNDVGIVAPLDEENTTSVFKIEMSNLDPLTFWKNNANTDQFSIKNPEKQKFE